MEEKAKIGRPPLPKGEAATGHIHIRTTLRRKSAYVRAANGKPLAEWMTEVCDRAAQYALATRGERSFC